MFAKLSIIVCTCLLSKYNTILYVVLNLSRILSLIKKYIFSKTRKIRESFSYYTSTCLDHISTLREMFSPTFSCNAYCILFQCTLFQSTAKFVAFALDFPFRFINSWVREKSYTHPELGIRNRYECDFNT